MDLATKVAHSKAYGPSTFPLGQHAHGNSGICRSSAMHAVDLMLGSKFRASEVLLASGAAFDVEGRL